MLMILMFGLHVALLFLQLLTERMWHLLDAQAHFRPEEAQAATLPSPMGGCPLHQVRYDQFFGLGLPAVCTLH